MDEKAVLCIEDLSVSFRVYGGRTRVLDRVAMHVGRGERVGLVGETGCGKTTMAKTVLGILPREGRVDSGSVLLGDKDVLGLGERALQRIRRKTGAMIFQDPTASLNPIFTVGDQVASVVRAASSGGRGVGRRGRREQVQTTCRALERASLPDPRRILTSYPFQLSGGMRQRVCIAMALATDRELLIADEPTTNLDVTIQDQVLRLITRLVEEQGMSLVLITHSLGVARETTNRIYAMYAGTMVESARTEDLFKEPMHPYTRGLVASVPRITGEGIAEGIPGRLPDYLEPPPGCRFMPRCPQALAVCAERKPATVEVAPGHYVDCFLYGGSEERND